MLSRFALLALCATALVGSPTSHAAEHFGTGHAAGSGQLSGCRRHRPQRRRRARDRLGRSPRHRDYQRHGGQPGRRCRLAAWRHRADLPQRTSARIRAVLASRQGDARGAQGAARHRPRRSARRNRSRDRSARYRGVGTTGGGGREGSHRARQARGWAKSPSVWKVVSPGSVSAARTCGLVRNWRRSTVSSPSSSASSAGCSCGRSGRRRPPRMRECEPAT